MPTPYSPQTLFDVIEARGEGSVILKCRKCGHRQGKSIFEDDVVVCNKCNQSGLYQYPEGKA